MASAKRARVTSSQVAERAGVSRTTVSFVLNDVDNGKVAKVTRERVLQVAAELGYVPDAAARTLVSGKTGTVGMVVSKAEHIRVDAFVPQTLYSLTTVCAKRGYRLLVETSEVKQSAYDYEQLVDAKQIDGLVVLNPNPSDSRLTSLIEQGFPLVLLGAHSHPDVAAVYVNSAAGMTRATNHLIGHGHSDLGFIHYRAVSHLGMGGRFGGFVSALGQAGLRLREEWVMSGNYSAESGYDAMRSLLKQDRVPTAVLAGNDTIAIGAMAAIGQAGLRIPDDIAIVGFDDIPLARFTIPALTTIRLPSTAMAEACGQMILDLINCGSVEPRKREFEAELVVRRSCGTTSCVESSID